MNKLRDSTVWPAARAAVALLVLAVLASSCEDPVTLPPPPEPPIDSPAAVVSALSRAYQQRNPELLQSLLANAPEANAKYLFLLSEPSYLGETQWDYSEEVRIHQRMFRPDQTPPTDPPVASELWMQRVTITLTPVEGFGERRDLYSADAGRDGKLDPLRWRALDARYSTYVFWDLVGRDYKVDGHEANFVIIEDLDKQVGAAGKFLLFIWEDLGGGFAPKLNSDASWSQMKALYK